MNTDGYIKEYRNCTYVVFDINGHIAFYEGNFLKFYHSLTTHLDLKGSDLKSICIVNKSVTGVSNSIISINILNLELSDIIDKIKFEIKLKEAGF